MSAATLYNYLINKDAGKFVEDGIKASYTGAADMWTATESQGIYILNKIKTFFGNATYQWLYDMFDPEIFTERVALGEHYIYGSSRLGERRADSTMYKVEFKGSFNSDGTANRDSVNYTIAASLDTEYFDRILGRKSYELTNHLGSVMAVVSDMKIPVRDSTDTTKVAYWEADVRSATPTYPYGMLLVGRQYLRQNVSGYRYLMNGQERDDEIYGAGNSYSAEYWQYDARLGRRWNVDPVEKHHESSYAAFANNPIYFIDPNGLDTTVYFYAASEKVSEEEVKKAMQHAKDIFAKNGITNLKFEFITKEEAKKLALDESDALVPFVWEETRTAQGGSRVYLSDGQTSKSTILTFMNYRFASRAAYFDEEVDPTYYAGYVAAHEILHQYISKAGWFMGYRFGDNFHQNDVDNLNAAGDHLSKVPKQQSQDLRQPEKILEWQKDFLNHYFKYNRRYEKVNGDYIEKL